MSVSKKYYHDIDLVKNSFRNAKLNPLTTAQRLNLNLTVDDEGYFVFDSTLDFLYFWNGTTWLKVSGIDSFIQLLDTPNSYLTHANKILRVSPTEDSVVFDILNKSDVGLSNVDNTSDLNKPISTATQSALDNKSNVGHTHDDRYYTESEIDAMLANIGGVEQFNLSTDFPLTGNPNKLYVARNENNRAYYWNNLTNSYVKVGSFNSNFVVSLSGTKTFLKWTTGQTVPAQGKTAQEILLEGAVEPINPTLTLTSPTTIPFNQVNISNVLNWTVVINSLGASIQSLNLEWRRNNSGSWTSLTTNTSLLTFTHTLTDSAFNTQPFNYRLTVIDSVGGQTTVTLNLTPQAYVAPTISFSANGTISTPETQTKREWGNTASTLAGSITRNSVNVPLQSYQLQVSINGGAWTNVGSSTSIGPASGTISATPHTATSSANSVAYRVQVVDSFQTTTSTVTINLVPMIYFGPADVNATLNSALIRSLSRRFADAGSPFSFSSGTTQRRFIVALNSPRVLDSALDTTQNQNLTSNFILNPFDVNDASGSPRSFNNYVYTNALPYTVSVNLQITYSPSN